MNGEEFKKQIGKFRTQKQKLLNNTYIWNELAIQSLKDSLKNDDFINSKEFQVPSKNKINTIKRTSEQVTEILEKAIAEDLYCSLLTFVIAQVESYMNDVISLCLHFDNKRLKIKVQGFEHIKKIEIIDIIDSSDKDKIISLIIEKELNSLFYAGPEKQKTYFANVLKVNIEDDLWYKWIECKATRDLIVHNKSIINETYFFKAKNKSRGKIGEKIEINKEYFDQTLAILKTIIGRISSKIQKEFNPI